jgi:hypothetical protein
MVMIAMSLVVAACGAGDTAVGDTEDRVRPSTADPTTTTSLPPLDGMVLPLADEFWHSGFHVELTKAEIFRSRSIYASRISYWLRVWGDFENQGDDVAAFEPEMTITASDGSFNYRRGRPPQVLPASSALGYLTFLIPEDLDVESAELVVGAVVESQARIPLGSPGNAVRLEPTDVEVSGRLATELIDFDFTGASLRHDLPNLHRQLELGKRALTLHFDVTSRIRGDVRISPDDIALILPDGSLVAPAAGELGSLPGDDDGITTVDRYVSFVVDETPTGDFTLRLTLDALVVEEDGDAEATFDFSL